MYSKKRVMDALAGYERKQGPQFVSPMRKNEKPEKAVEEAVLIWCKLKQWDVDVIEAKAKFNTQTMQYTGRAASPGISDIVGNTQDGLAVYIELKAPGRRVASALGKKRNKDGKQTQREFLIKKIQTNCFAIVTDSVEYLERTWSHFLSLNKNDRINYLLEELPKPKQRQLSLFTFQE